MGQLVVAGTVRRKATMRMRVYRATTNRWEDYGIVSATEPLWLARLKDWLRRFRREH